ncbi:heat-inducible transcriptional repressor HrcA [Glycomyces sp. TRM65418]|uniref:heat-inducible transcriptional repressor HrcA n=1 Tax=Glycomyces sp. TRM65418 TaxID=2867006 RepID=UPI001CE70E5F|nr:heat-inducible transcriptional repressor HrcA [Glycomyces sp. TRM65418]MCC3765807.1 heat-inducible transcriptional repressor HrcA [Glycomyces sp. TRM65418]QZD55394.1 heat-inducible transcriptional repressor HrcA [Glycomyces sp. TRM65418]
MDDRKLEVLRAIVEDYVATQEPVGSKAVAQRHALGVSAATVRNDMAYLEEAGYIQQPHTSAGRIPTAKGYRLFVDRLGKIKPLSAAERRAVHRFLSEAIDLDDVVTRTVRLLAQLTHQVAVVQYPSLNRSSVRHLELVSLTPTRLMLVMITDTGRVEQRYVEVPAELGEEHVLELRRLVNEQLQGKALADVPSLIADLAGLVRPELRDAAAELARVLKETVVARTEERVAVAGAANLTRGNFFAGSMRPILEALEEEVVLMQLLGRADSNALLTVRIGDENEIDDFRETTVVTAGYGPGSVVGHMGVLGPTRMDYPGTIAAVRAVARYVSEILEQNR